MDYDYTWGDNDSDV
jgi:hypothetical protein